MGKHTHSWPSHHAGVAAAIDYLAGNYEDQPSLGDMASAAGMSAHHFQRTFKTWTGVSPKRFLQFVTLGHAKRLLDGRASVLDAALEAGLSGPGRLHDLFVACEAVTPGEYKSRGRGLEIRYGLHDGPFGRTLLGVTSRGICWLSFVKGGDDRGAVEEFSAEWPASELIEDGVSTGTAAARAFRFAMGEGAEPLSCWCSAPTSRSRCGRPCSASPGATSSATRTWPAPWGAKAPSAPSAGRWGPIPSRC